MTHKATGVKTTVTSGFIAVYDLVVFECLAKLRVPKGVYDCYIHLHGNQPIGIRLLPEGFTTFDELSADKHGKLTGAQFCSMFFADAVRIVELSEQNKVVWDSDKITETKFESHQEKVENYLVAMACDFGDSGGGFYVGRVKHKGKTIGLDLKYL
jgi:hypothetical protein